MINKRVASALLWAVFAVGVNAQDINKFVEAQVIDKSSFQVTCNDGDKTWLEVVTKKDFLAKHYCCLLYTSPSPRDKRQSRMPSSA